jgi:4-aminobutyrate aminotransferase-like enzyme/Ser/Thr protein kinase RdoA (MazF antagonist)
MMLVPDPLLTPRPEVAPKLAAALLADVYGITGELTELHGERDLNFRVDATDGRRYVLKVHHPEDSGEVAEMRTMAMAQVRRVDPGLPVPEVVRTPTGAIRAAIAGADGRISDVQVLTFLEGAHPETAKLGASALGDWGRVTARLGRALRGFFHPAAGYRIQWDIRHTSSLRDRLHLLDPETRRLVEPVIDRFETGVAPRFDALRAQVIHNDMNPRNVLVDAEDRIVGITDFGDMTHTALVCDLAVALAEVLVGRDDGFDAATPMVAGYCEVTPLEDEEVALLADLVTSRAATDVVVTTWRRLHHRHAEELPDASLAFLRRVESVGIAELADLLTQAARSASGASRSALFYRTRPTSELRAARARVLGALELSYEEPLHLVRGSGVHLFDADGRRYLDAYNNVPVAGHSHPAVAAAIAAQSRLLVTNTRYLHESSVELAEQLLQRAPEGLKRVLFVNSGSEANDVAWRIARLATGHDGALVTRFAYHGVTEATTVLSPEEWPAGFAPRRVGLLSPPGEPGGAGVVVNELEAAGHPPAALYVDPAFTSDGILGPAPAWLEDAVSSTRAAGGLFVGDEVQAGYGRTGMSLWSVTPSGVDPDLLTLGKPMGNGFPVAAVLGRADLVDPFVEATGYFSTFGGNTLACAAALAVLHVVEEEHLIERAAASGTRLRSLVDEVSARHDAAGAVRSWGLLLGVEIVDHNGAPDPDRARRAVNAMRRLGVLIGTTGPAANVLKIRPPLVFAEADGEELATRLDEVLSAL